MVLLGYSSLLLASKCLIILIGLTERCQGQFGGVATVDTNPDTGAIPVMIFQGNKSVLIAIISLFLICIFN